IAGRRPDRRIWRLGLDLGGSAKAAGSGRIIRAGTQGTGRERQRRRAGRHATRAWRCGMCTGSGSAFGRIGPSAASATVNIYVDVPGAGSPFGIRFHKPGQGTDRWLLDAIVSGNMLGTLLTKIDRDPATVPFIAIGGNLGD